MNKTVTTTQHLRTVARLTFGNAASLIYLGVVAATAVFVTVDTLFVTHEDASLSGVWLFFLAAPTVFLFLLLDSTLWGADSAGPDWYMYLALIVSVLVQSFVLGWFVRLLRGGSGRTHSRSAHPQGA